MLTINYYGKTYKWIGDKWGTLNIDDTTMKIDCTVLGTVEIYNLFGTDVYTQLYHTPEQLVKLGYLEEVKENKEPLHEMETHREKTVFYKFPFSEGRTEIEIPIGARNYYINGELYNGADTSILEKLREELKTKIRSWAERGSISDTKNQVYQELLDLLTSLETKEETTEKDPGEEASALCAHIVKTSDPLHCLKCGEVFSEKEVPQFTPGQEEPEVKIRDVGNGFVAFDRKKKESWTPTPGQEIEVSNDGEKWEKREFIRVNDSGEYICNVPPNGFHYSWKFARPINKIEPELPSVPNFNTTSDLIIDDFSVLKQIEILTKFCQTLARQKPTK